MIVNTINPPKLDYYLHDEQLLRRHKMAIPTPEAYLFFPTDFQCIEFDEKHPKKTLRRIFEKKENKFIQFEEDKMEELMKEIEKHNQKSKKDILIIPKGYNKYEIRKFLQATSFDCSKTIQLLRENIEWRKTLIPPKITVKVVELLNCGFMYVHGRDNNFRPIIVINADIYMKLKDKYVYDDWLFCIIYFMEYMINNLLIPGQVENWNIITDLGGVSLIFMPSDMKKFMGVLQSNYRCRLYVNFIIGMSSFLRGIWSFVKNFLDETTIKKIRFLKEDTLNEIFAFINEDQVEKRYGGNAPNIIAGETICFPPIMPSTNFLKNSGTKSQGIISEDEYRELHEQNKLAITGEFYLNKWREEAAERERNIKQIEEERFEKITFEEEAKVNMNNDLIIFEEINTSSNLSRRLDELSVHNIKKLEIQVNPDNYINIIENEYTNTNRYKISDMKKKLHCANAMFCLKGSLIGKEINCNTPPILAMKNKNENSSKNGDSSCGDNSSFSLKRVKFQEPKDNLCHVENIDNNVQYDNENISDHLSDKSQTVFENRKIGGFCNGPNCFIY